MPFSVDPEQVRNIASQCSRSGENIQQEAANMNTQMHNLQQAIQGLPVSMEDRFAEWNRLFSQLSESLQESQTFLNSIATRVEEVMNALR